MHEIRVNSPQGSFLKTDKPFRCFCGGYGSGKTFTGCVQLCLNAWEYPGINQGYFAPTFPHIRDIFYPTIDEVSHMMGLSVDIKESNKEVHFYQGKIYRGTVICRSMDRPQNIIGFKIGHAMVDEIDTMPTNKATMSWQKILARMRYQGAKNSIDLTTTPEGFKFTYQTFVERLQEKPELNDTYALVRASTHENSKNLPDGYIQSIQDAYPKELIEAYLEGKFVNLTSGTVFYAYNPEIHDSKETIIKGEPLFIGMDFNVQKMAAAIFVQRNNGFHAVDELKDIFDTPAMVDTIKQRYEGHRIIVYPDATGKNRESVDASKSDISLLRQAGFEIRAHGRNPFVKDRILATNKAFQDGKINVNKAKCRTISDSLQKLAYDKNGEPDKSSGFDHMCDAATYMISYEFPVQKPVPKIPITFAR